MKNNILVSIVFILSISCSIDRKLTGSWVNSTICLPDQTYVWNFDKSERVLLNGDHKSFRIENNKVIDNLSNTMLLDLQSVKIEKKYIGVPLYDSEKLYLHKYNLISINKSSIDKGKLMNQLWLHKEDSFQIYFEFHLNDKATLTKVNQKDTTSYVIDWNLYKHEKSVVLLTRDLFCNSMYLQKSTENSITYSYFKSYKDLSKSYFQKVNNYPVSKIDLLIGKWKVQTFNGGFLDHFSQIEFKENDEVIIDNFKSVWEADAFNRIILFDRKRSMSLPRSYFEVKNLKVGELILEYNGIIYSLLKV